MSSSNAVEWNKQLSDLSNQSNQNNHVNNPSYVNNIRKLSSKIPSNTQFSQDDANNVCSIILSLLNNIKHGTEINPRNQDIVNVISKNNSDFESEITQTLNDIKNLNCSEVKNSNDYSDKDTNTELTSENTIVWIRDEVVSECQICKSQFTFINRKHHCRICGNIFCGNCCSSRKTLSGYDTPQRVCNECNKNVNE